MIYRANGFYTYKCKDAETAGDKLGRFLENANCTLHQGKQRLKTGLNKIHYTFQIGVDHFKNKLGINQATPKPVTESTTNKYDGLDHQMDIRMLTEDDIQLTTRPKREASDEDEDQGKS